LLAALAFPAGAGAQPSPADSLGTPPVAAPDTLPVPEVEVQAPPQRVRRIGTISVEGNTWSDRDRIIRTFDVPTGSRFSDDALRRGLRKLFALGLFADAWVETRERGDEVDLVLHVLERARIGKITFTGQKVRDAEDLEGKLILKVGDPYHPTQVQTQIDSLKRYYREEGYPRAEFDSKTDTLADKRLELTFLVREGERVRIERIQFEGASAINVDAARKKFKNKARGFFGGGEPKDEEIANDIGELERFYHNRGYRDMRVVGHEFRPGSKPDRQILVFTIDEGRLYKFGDVRWSGNRSIGNEALERVWRNSPSRVVYDQSRIDQARSEVFAMYAEEGYLYLDIDPRESVRDSALVDVTFVITEGRPSEIRYVNITGNRGTREHVIRREMAIHEGDRFRRSTLVRTQGDIFRLGLFEDVQIDFSPADSSDVDIVLKVKEKQVGTASAGAGFTGETGLTGFLELGHNNVLGNNQSLNLHLERGGRRQDYVLSFTEPWFRGTPTLLGFSLFNSERERDIYIEKRIGGSGRIGRPLPWPDYARGSIAYRLERVQIDALTNTLTATDSVALQGLPLGERVLTSSVTLLFQRNSANHPQYPTGGTRLTLESELAGGLFGGSVHFNKNRLDGRIYFPSPIRGVSTMMRARLGVLSPYVGQSSPVPEYERFRLGGGTTLDPLRGYDDYLVVPEKFIRSVHDTLDKSAPFDSVSTAVVRYPGGRFMSVYTLEQQFPIVHPLHAVLFFDAGNTWDLGHEVRPFDLNMSAGIGFRLEIPLLGNIGFDYGYGFDRIEYNSLTDTFVKRPRWKGHFLLGNFGF
jgi:outer membrane protein insertion porin family